MACRCAPFIRFAPVAAFVALSACTSADVACSLDESEWVGQEPECTDEERAQDTVGVCSAPRISFRGCEYRRTSGGELFSGSYVDDDARTRFLFEEDGSEGGGFLQDGGYSLLGPGGFYVRTTEFLVPWD